MARFLTLLVLLSTLIVGGCQSSEPVTTGDDPAALRARIHHLQAVNDSLSRVASLRNPNLHSTLWAQTSVEYLAVARQAYALAQVRMREALRDSGWTASIQQAKRGASAYGDKPPAVVLDVDETVLDNSAYQARLVLDDETYKSDTWKAWVREEKAGIVPGARSFTRAAVDAGVQVIYLTNRDGDVEAATRANLRALGFPVVDAPDAVLTQSEKAGWESKTARRAWVAERYRILLLIGDNFGDFVPGADTSLKVRRRTNRSFREYWGTRWIVLPNAQYGSWEAALYDFEYGVSPLRRLRMKHRQLEPKR